MPGFVPGIHVLSTSQESRTWMAGTSLATTKTDSVRVSTGIRQRPHLWMTFAAYAAFVLLFFDVAVVPITSLAANSAISLALSPSTSPSTS